MSDLSVVVALGALAYLLLGFSRIGLGHPMPVWTVAGVAFSIAAALLRSTAVMLESTTYVATAGWIGVFVWANVAAWGYIATVALWVVATRDYLEDLEEARRTDQEPAD